MTDFPKNPFIYGPPVLGDEFLNHEFDLSSILNRIRSGQSTVIVGEPHIGKSSILLHISNKKTCEKYIGQDAKKLLFSFLDLHPVDDKYSPSDFWEDVLKPLKERFTDKVFRELLGQASQSHYDRKSIVQIIGFLVKRDLKLILLLDEFDRLLYHPNFQDGSFFAFLRSLNQERGLVIVLTSRYGIAKLHDIKKTQIGSASPFFNTMIDHRVKPFDDKSISGLLGRAEKVFSQSDKDFIVRMAGRNPFLLQAMAATLYEKKVEFNDDELYLQSAILFYERISFHFDDLWTTLGDNTRTTAVILSLIELGKRAFGQKFACGEIESIEKFGPQLQDLQKLGLAEQIGNNWQFDVKNLMLWQGQKWAISSQAFAWWIRDVIISKTRTHYAYDSWLSNKNYVFLGVTNEQWTWLVSTIQSAPTSVISGVTGIAKTIIMEMVKKK